VLSALLARVRGALRDGVHTDAVSAARALVYVAVAGTLLANGPRQLVSPLGGPAGDGAALERWQQGACSGLRSATFHCVVPAGALPVGQILLALFLLVAAAGLWPRWTAIPAWWIAWSSSVTVSSVVADGGDKLAAILALLLIPVGLADGRRLAWSRFGPARPARSLTLTLLARYALALAAVQMAVVYLESLVGKLSRPQWGEGTALYYIAQDPLGAFGSTGERLLPLLERGPIVAALSWGTLMLEAALCVVLFLPRARRRPVVVAGIAFHLGICLAMGLTSFALTAIGGLLLFGWPLGPRADGTGRAGEAEPDAAAPEGDRPEGGTERAAPAVAALPPAVPGRQGRRFGRTLRATIGIVRACAPGDLYLLLGLQLVAAGLVVVQLLVLQRVLVRLTAPDLDAGAGLTAGILALAGVTAFGALLAAFQGESQVLLGEKVTRHATGLVLDVAATASMAEYDDEAFHDRLERARVAAEQQPMALTIAFTGMLASAIGAVGVVVALAVLEPLILPIVAAGVIPVWFTNRRRGLRRYRFQFGATPENRERLYLQRLLSTREPAAELRAYRSTGFLRRRYERLWDWRLVQIRTLTRQRTVLALVGALGMATAAALGLLVLVRLINSGRTSLATAGAAAVALQQLTTRLSTLSTTGGRMHESALFLQDLTAFVGERPGVPGAAGALAAPPERPPGFSRIRIEGVTFTYPGAAAPALEDVDVTIAAGEVVALVGENGSGKSTLAKLVAGLYAPDEGTIAFDVDPGAPPAGGPDNAVALMFQDFTRYPLTGRDNIVLGDVDHDRDAEVPRAAERAGIDAALRALPHGYDTRLSKEFAEGADLSLGQWQRLALARAYHRDAALLILDEPSAALDPLAEERLFEEVRNLLAGRTVILITHRMASVRLADRVLVLADGRVVETGTHRSLLDARGLYHRLFTTQAGGYRHEG